MNKKLFSILITFISISFIMASTAEAKRFGGGSSFGSKKSYSSPYKQKSTQSKTFSQQKAAATNQQRKQQLASRGGLMGILGGLALGGLLGALFFGGAFEGFNFFDFLIIGGVILAVMWFMKRKTPAPQAQTSAPGGFDINMESSGRGGTHTDIYADGNRQNRLAMDKPDADFSDLKSESKKTNSKKEPSFAESFGMNNNHSEETLNHPNSGNEVILPDWFNQQEFLSGARSAYTLLQEAWDSGDLESIKGLTTDSVFTEISRQFSQEPSQGATRIMQLNAELIDFNELDEHTEASVLFDALLGETDENGNQGRTSQVRELWHFIRGTNSTAPTWYLDGIQQLE